MVRSVHSGWWTFQPNLIFYKNHITQHYKTVQCPGSLCLGDTWTDHSLAFPFLLQCLHLSLRCQKPLSSLLTPSLCTHCSTPSTWVVAASSWFSSQVWSHHPLSQTICKQRLYSYTALKYKEISLQLLYQCKSVSIFRPGYWRPPGPETSSASPVA